MKKIFIAILSLGLFFCVSAGAADIGYIDLTSLAPKMQKTAEQKWLKQYGTQAKSQADLLKKEEDAFKQALASYQKKYKFMSDDIKKSTEQDLKDQQQKLQTTMTDFQKKHFEQQQKISSALLADIKDQAVDLAKKYSYDMVVFKASILYQSKNDTLVDITNKINIS
jgi:Skp family chaperone for outer membrane proteins